MSRTIFAVGPCLDPYGHNSHMSIFASINIDNLAHGPVRIGYQSIFLTMSSTCRLVVGVLHLLKRWSFRRYSVDHLRQKCWLMACSSDHRHRSGSFFVVRSISGRAWTFRPIKKWSGVRTSMPLSECDWRGTRGLLLRQHSTWHSTVVNSSKVSCCSPTTLLRWNLALFTAASQSPPKWRAFFRREMPFDSLSSLLWQEGINIFQHVVGPHKVWPVWKWVRHPLQATNLLRAARKASLVKSDTSSMWTALVEKHTNRHAYAFRYTGRLVWSFLMTKGPAKSIPVWLKGADGVTLDAGSCPIICCWGFAACYAAPARGPN